MAKQILSITFAKQIGPTEPQGYHSRVKNFAEEIDRGLQRSGQGLVETNIDRYFELLTVCIFKRRNVSPIRRHIEKLSRSHMLDGDIAVSLSNAN